ncbi:hypothetical protein TNCV_2494201 [Trichonephila clavipes]|uniref:Uncharacterized protein n=1 Tax=Trichonephila clavipes TaxID=2585209 RepID=A0A8X6VAQ2_TRICX|nr:hypothetical protein TNCV_2494201 [Trichonephila clavipes]
MLDHLEDNIRRVIADIRPQMLEKVIENWKSRLDYIRASRGSPMPEIIFKIQIKAHEIHRGKGLEVRLLALSIIQVTVRICLAKFPKRTTDGDTTSTILGMELKGREIFSSPLHL